MKNYILLDENNNQIILPSEQAIQRILYVLKNGVRKGNMFIIDEKAYEYLELAVGENTVRVLKDVTSFYKMINDKKMLENDIEILKEENKILKKDELTGLYRPDCAMKFVREYILYAYETNTEFALIMADIDNFKSINDTYGHEFGNRILESVGSTLLNNVRTNTKDSSRERREINQSRNFESNDIVIRYGGEEIIILMKKINLEDAVKRIEQIRKKISEIEINGVSVTMSFGIYHFNDRKYAPEITKENNYMMERKFVEIADKMMYNSKQNGRNKTSYYNSLTGECILVDSKEKEL